jgi:hypothetical protein
MKASIPLILLALCTTVFGQTPSAAVSPTPLPLESSASPVQEQQPIWRCELPGGIAEVAVRSIVSVSSHEYTVDGTSRVVEVNIDTLGNMALRFYFIALQPPAAPLGAGQSALDRAREIAKDLSGRTGMDGDLRRAAKNYPASTHSHTVEYRLESEEQLKKVLNSASTTFRSGSSGTLKLPEP